MQRVRVAEVRQRVEPVLDFLANRVDTVRGNLVAGERLPVERIRKIVTPEAGKIACAPGRQRNCRIQSAASAAARAVSYEKKKNVLFFPL